MELRPIFLIFKGNNVQLLCWSACYICCIVKPTVFTDFSAFLKYDMHLYLHLKSYLVILHKFNKLEQPANKRRSLPLVWSVSHLCLVLLCCILDHGGSKAALVIKHGVPQVITQITLFLLWVMNLININKCKNLKADHARDWFRPWPTKNYQLIHRQTAKLQSGFFY